jgi:hypothetical protein
MSAPITPKAEIAIPVPNLTKQDAARGMLRVLADRVPTLALAPDWTALFHAVSAALRATVSPPVFTTALRARASATDGTGACVYQVDGQNVCAVLTRAECDYLRGAFCPDATC